MNKLNSTTKDYVPSKIYLKGKLDQMGSLRVFHHEISIFVLFFFAFVSSYFVMFCCGVIFVYDFLILWKGGGGGFGYKKWKNKLLNSKRLTSLSPNIWIWGFITFFCPSFWNKYHTIPHVPVRMKEENHTTPSKMTLCIYSDAITD